LSNLFATRDNWRHQVVDLSQMLRVARDDSFEPNLQAASGNAELLVNTAQIDYVGQSLGVILGSLYTSVSPDVEKAVLNVPGADPVLILTESPSFAPQLNAFKAGLAASGVNEGTPAFDTFSNFARWILDPADPQNTAVYMKNSATRPAGRDVLLQYITEDQTIPNRSTERLIAAANRPLAEGENNQCKVAEWNPAVTATSTQVDAADPGLRLQDRHGFLLNFAGATTDPTKTFTAAAQGQAVGFLATGAVSPIPDFAK
ncbi:MAG TPA: hypothetical protein VFO83_09635, partial [Aggregicoccus sp.]|nr:hypothetical protein [Aggregicoccus sp.]